MMKGIYVKIIVCSLLLVSCGRTINPTKQVESIPDIFPDYIGVTIPCNIAPMNFQLNRADSLETQLIISAGTTNNGRNCSMNRKARTLPLRFAIKMGRTGFPISLLPCMWLQIRLILGWLID